MGYKIMVAQRGATRQNYEKFEDGWRYPNYTWVTPPSRSCGQVDGTWENTQGRFKPCLFDLEADPREQHDLSQDMPELLSALYKKLNDTWRTYYYARSPQSSWVHVTQLVQTSSGLHSKVSPYMDRCVGCLAARVHQHHHLHHHRIANGSMALAWVAIHWELLMPPQKKHAVEFA